MESCRRVGLIGYGLAGRVFHAPLIEATAGLEISAIVTADPARAAQARADHPAARVDAGVDRVLAGPDRVDLVVLATPNASHLPLGLQAIEAGVPVVVDKPLAAAVADGRRLLARAAQARVPVTVFQNRRWDGDFRTLQVLLDGGRLGRVHRFESRFERWSPQVDPGRWREDPHPSQAGGVLVDLGAHLIDQALVLFGPATSVYAEQDRRRPGSAVDDDSFIALTHANGVRSQLWTSRLAAQPGPRFRLLGALAGYLSYGLDPQEGQLAAGLRPGAPDWGRRDRDPMGTLVADGREEAVPLLPGQYQSFYAGLVAALDGKQPLPIDPADSLVVLEIIEAARRSAEEGQVLALPG